MFLPSEAHSVGSILLLRESVLLALISYFAMRIGSTCIN